MQLRRIRWCLPPVAAACALGVIHHLETRAASKAAVQAQETAAADAPAAKLNLSARVIGSVSALNSVNLLAPRILGSRSGVNRGGDTSGGAGGLDFNLVLLSLAKPGTHVKTGDVVAQFDPQNQVQRLDDYKDAVVQLENNIQGMMASLTSLKEAHDQSVRSAKASWEQAELDLQTAPVLSEIDVEKRKLTRDEAEATYKQLVQESALVEESQRAQIRIAELNRDQSRIELQRAQANVDKMTIRSPIEGIVVMANVVRNGELGQIREGDQVNAGQPFMNVVDPRSMVLGASVNQVDAERFRLGMKAIVRLDAYPDLALPGTLTGIGAMATTSAFRGTFVGQIPVRVQIERLDPRLIPDLTGSAEVVLQPAR